MYQPRHRARTRDPIARPSLAVALTSAACLCVVGGLAPAAYAGGPGGFGPWTHNHHQVHQPTHKPTTPTHGPTHKPTTPGTTGGTTDPAQSGTGDGDGVGPTSTESLSAALSNLTPTPEPLTPYELPFPCGETWVGDTHVGHTPSIRAVDFNSANDLGKPVVAAASGTVTTAVSGANLTKSYGQYVVIDHGNGESSLYGHLNSVTVTVGQQITQGAQIGTLGSTGNSTGPHLHFEERLNGQDQDEWFHGVKLLLDVPTVSQNCGTGTPPPTVQYVPFAGNLYGTAPAEVGLFQRSTPGTFLVTRTAKPEKVVSLGQATDQPVLGDWNGDGRVELGVRSPATGTFTLRLHGKHTQTVRMGKSTDLPIAGNWDGTGPWEVGVRRANSGTFKLRLGPHQVKTVYLGKATDLPVTGDWNGDGVTDLGVYDPATATFTLEWVDGAGVTWTTQVVFGVPGDLPVAGDWDGNGVTDLGVWDPTTKLFSERSAPAPTAVRSSLRRVAVKGVQR